MKPFRQKPSHQSTKDVANVTEQNDSPLENESLDNALVQDDVRVESVEEDVKVEETSIEEDVIEELAEEADLKEGPEEEPKTDSVYGPLFASMKNNRKAIEQSEAFLSRFNAYMNALRPGVPVNNADMAARSDMTFWKAIQSVMNIEDFATFRAVWNVVLLTFKENSNGIFHDRYVDRFKSHWTLSKEEAEKRDAIFNMLKLTCDPNTRAQGLKSFDMGRALKGLTANQNQNITAFYEAR